MRIRLAKMKPMGNITHLVSKTGMKMKQGQLSN